MVANTVRVHLNPWIHLKSSLLVAMIFKFPCYQLILVDSSGCPWPLEVLDFQRKPESPENFMTLEIAHGQWLTCGATNIRLLGLSLAYAPAFPKRPGSLDITWNHILVWLPPFSQPASSTPPQISLEVVVTKSLIFKYLGLLLREPSARTYTHTVYMTIFLSERH